MFVQVKLLSGYQQLLWYKIPDHWEAQNYSGAIVQVPLRNKIVPAWIMEMQKDMPSVAFTIKEVQNLEPFPADPHYFAFIDKLSIYYQIEPLYFIKRIQLFLKQKEQPIEIIET